MSQLLDLLSELKHNGAVVLPECITKEELGKMQRSFQFQLERPAFNSWTGYAQTDRKRLMVEQLLILDSHFCQLPLMPLINSLIVEYLGKDICLQEAKGWQSLPFKDNFHPLHRDEWYCTEYYQSKSIPRSLKLGCYLDDVESGAFAFVAGSHRHQHQGQVGELYHHQTEDYELTKVIGKAGTLFLFDPECLHQQSYPNLTARNALFYHFFSPSVVLSKNFTQWGRFQRLLIESSFLSGLNHQQLAFLGCSRQPCNDIPDIQHFLSLSKPLNIAVRSLNEAHYLFEKIKARLFRT
ncbi:phytanoyl-CoA dioxygenase family protein [Photobacterium angustum]|uniref:Phytanoyl-CoA dioxygenase n=1 Tax=Photobacterium angustum TaxID=661 RepID=A0A2S7VHG7_PHOAN|nr:phytanoyl-CoA dioxygenase family protein [Photobacterium angustum]PQJ61636.1 phytanoyl-CoA dioxygenase [Photobacterium angustum]